MDTTLTDVFQALAGIAVVGVTAFASLRAAAKKVSADIPQFKEDKAHGDFIERLQQEVSRLENIIQRMQERIEELEQNSGRVIDRMVLFRAEAIDVYARIAHITCDCVAREDWAELQRGVRRLVDLPHVETGFKGEQHERSTESST